MTERRLSAIMAADVVGYSRLMSANEVGTLTALTERRLEVIEPAIASFGRRVVKLTGDGLLAEFGSVVAAVECAGQVQAAMLDRNAHLPEDRRIELRIGINLGDVIVQGDDIFGDGVNIAARLEGVGRPGGVTVSDSVRHNVGNRLAVVFVDRGDQLLKNIPNPVRAYDVIPDSQEAPGATAGTGPETDGKPSIAVLPFDNMSGDIDQEYFSDGICEDMITDLSKVSGLFVVGRNSSFAYKGRATDLRSIAMELGVRYLLEGSVRKAANRVRINAQLIDGVSGGHVWADRFDRDLTDIFAIQDEITRTIVDELKIQLLPQERVAIVQAPTDDVEAYAEYLKGRRLFQNATRRHLEEARAMFQRAIDRDGDYAKAYAALAVTEVRRNEYFRAGVSPDTILALADRAIRIDPALAFAHAARSAALGDAGRREEAQAAFERALVIDPDSHEANQYYSHFLMTTGKFERSSALSIRALEIDPEDFVSPLFATATLRAVGRAEESKRYGDMGIKRAEDAMRRDPEFSRPAQLLATTYAAMGNVERARHWLNHALAVDPDDNLARYNAACALALLGDHDEALDILAQWTESTGPGGFAHAREDPDLVSLRAIPRFKSMLAEAERRRASA